jgi:hypothetical protein
MRRKHLPGAVLPALPALCLADALLATAHTHDHHQQQYVLEHAALSYYYCRVSLTAAAERYCLRVYLYNVGAAPESKCLHAVQYYHHITYTEISILYLKACMPAVQHDSAIAEPFTHQDFEVEPNTSHQQVYTYQ